MDAAGIHAHGNDNGAGADLQRLVEPPVEVGGVENAEDDKMNPTEVVKASRA